MLALINVLLALFIMPLFAQALTFWHFSCSISQLFRCDSQHFCCNVASQLRLTIMDIAGVFILCGGIAFARRDASFLRINFRQVFVLLAIYWLLTIVQHILKLCFIDPAIK